MQKRVIWPINVDALRTRTEGRIIAQKDAVKSPQAEEIVKAAMELGLNPLYDPTKSYPRAWWEHTGRVLVDGGASRHELAKKISLRIKRNRGHQSND